MSLGEARPVGSTICAARGGVRWNSQHSKNCVSLSPRVENLKVKKVIKVCTSTTVSRQCFGIPMHVNVLRIRIFYVYSYIWLWLYNNSIFREKLRTPYFSYSNDSLIGDND